MSEKKLFFFLYYFHASLISFNSTECSVNIFEYHKADANATVFFFLLLFILVQSTYKLYKRTKFKLYFLFRFVFYLFSTSFIISIKEYENKIKTTTTTTINNNNNWNNETQSKEFYVLVGCAYILFEINTVFDSISFYYNLKLLYL